MSEVLVAILLLTIGIMAITIVQMRTVAITMDSQRKLTGMHIAKSYVEYMRMNPTARDTYSDNSYRMADLLAASAGVNCYNANCTPDQKARHDLGEIYRAATLAGMKFSTGCPIYSNLRSCIYVYWGDTLANDTFRSKDEMYCDTTVTNDRVESADCVFLEGFL